ncbi:SH3 domain-containing protein [Pseudonocardia sp.]|uniref:SH3 domain-containing protein n=1 Tax=Pseudonocardia sp. TaxID=60912 RepID=UPI0026028379|nr:SH3 domain-containing protein [Pseudonocardia sp.]
MKALQRPGRTAAVVGAVVAVSATTLMGFAGTALARVPGTCTDNVNVRAEPSIDSRIVALCEAGTAVETGATRDGFVRLMDLGGWASAEYISIDGAPPASSGPAPSTATSPTTEPTTEPTGEPTTEPTTRPSTRPAPTDETGSGTGGDAGDELRQTPSGSEPSTTGRNTFTPQESDTSPTTDDDEPEPQSPGLAGGLL